MELWVITNRLVACLSYSDARRNWHHFAKEGSLTRTQRRQLLNQSTQIVWNSSANLGAVGGVRDSQSHQRPALIQYRAVDLRRELGNKHTTRTVLPTFIRTHGQCLSLVCFDDLSI